MPFDTAIEYLIERTRDQAERLEKMKRPQWSLTKAGALPAFLTKFDTDAENGEWIGMTATKKGDINRVMGVRGRIAWLCGARSDVRRQFASGIADKPRTQMNRQRYQHAHFELSRRVLERLKEIQSTHRKKPVTKGG